MEAWAIVFWVGVLAADIAFMRNIKRLADKLFSTDKKAPGGAATPAKGRRQMTDVVYTITQEVSR